MRSPERGIASGVEGDAKGWQASGRAADIRRANSGPDEAPVRKQGTGKRIPGYCSDVINVTEKMPSQQILFFFQNDSRDTDNNWHCKAPKPEEVKERG